MVAVVCVLMLAVLFFAFPPFAFLDNGYNVSVTDGQKIIIDRDELTLTLYVNEQILKQYPVAVGKSSTPSPLGEWQIVHKDSGWGGGFGSRWMGLNIPWGIYGIHGTNKPWSINTRASGGCIRMNNRHAEELFSLVEVGTTVTIIAKELPLPKATLKLDDSGQDVVILQWAMRDHGFDPGKADGRYGPVTESTIRQLQSYYRLPVTGCLDEATMYLFNFR